MVTKYIADGIQVDLSTSQLVLETTGKGTSGIYKAKQVRNGITTNDEQLWLETNGDPVILPHAMYPDDLAAVLSDANVTMDQLEAAIGMPYSHWCN